MSNLKAAHAWPKGCTDCTYAAGKPVYCNAVKGGYSIERARRLIGERTGLSMPGAVEAQDLGPEGRNWLVSITNEKRQIKKRPQAPESPGAISLAVFRLDERAAVVEVDGLHVREGSHNLVIEQVIGIFC